MQPINTYFKFSERQYSTGPTSLSDRSYIQIRSMQQSDRSNIQQKPGFSFNYQQAKTLTGFQQERFLQQNSKLNLLDNKDQKCQKMISKLDDRQEAIKFNKIRIENQKFIKSIRQEQEESDKRLKIKSRINTRDEQSTARLRIKTQIQSLRLNLISDYKDEKKEMLVNYQNLIQNHNSNNLYMKAQIDQMHINQKLTNSRQQYKRKLFSQNLQISECHRTSSLTDKCLSEINSLEMKEDLLMKQLKNSFKLKTQSVSELMDIQLESPRLLQKKFSCPINPYIIIKNKNQKKPFYFKIFKETLE